VHKTYKTTNITLYLPINHSSVTAQVVIELTRSCVGAKIALEVDAVAAQEIFVPDLVDVFQVGGLRDVNLALVDKVLKIILVNLSPGLFRGVIGHGQMVSIIIVPFGTLHPHYVPWY
jgi:hypothetical protein